MTDSTLRLAELFRELRRRRVFRTAAVYVIGAWLALQVADVLFPAWGIPDAGIAVLFYAAILGFPVALVFGWLFDIGPGGIRRTAPARPGELEEAQPLRRSDRLLLGLFALVMAAIGYQAVTRILGTVDERAQTEPSQGPDRSMYSLAVLPFANMSPNPADEFLGDGFSEEILNKLAGVGELSVVGRTSSFAFKDSDYTIPRISELLGVRYLLQGSVRRDGDVLRITSNLVDHTGLQLWSESYDRKFRNIFALQSEIADAVLERVLPHVAPTPRPEWTPDIEAYQHYLIGRELLRKRPPGYQLDSIERFNQALAIEPDYAAAHAGLAMSLALAHTWFTDRTEQEVLEEARQAAEKALAIDPENASAYAALGLILQFQQDPAGSESALRRALALDPSHADAANWLAGTLTALGKHDESRALVEQAARKDPLAAIPNLNLAQDEASRGNFEAAEQRLKKLMELPEPSLYVPMALAELYVDTGRLVEANRTFKQRILFRIEREGAAWTPHLARNYAMLGLWERAELWQSQARRLFPELYQVAWYAGAIHVRQGQFDEAVSVVDQALAAEGLEVEGLGSWARWYGAKLALAGRHREAVELIKSSSGEIRDPFYEPNARHALAWSHQQLGQPAAARAVLEDLDRVFRDRQAIGELHLARDRFLFAQTTLLLGDTDLALEQLERAVEAGWLDYYFVLHDPRWDPVRDDPRFVRLMGQVKTELDRQRQEVEKLDAIDDFTARYEDAIARYRSRQQDNQP